MKHSIKFFDRILIFVFIGLMSSMVSISAQKANDMQVYVWDFSVNHDSIKNFGKLITEDFETELIKLGKYTVLERRHYHRVISHREMENSIQDVKDLPTSNMDSLKAIEAEVVIFGELNFDAGSGVYEVTVTFQNLNEIILKKGVIAIKKSLIDDNQFRKEFMRNLLDQLHAEEILVARKEQYNLISKLLKAYIVSVKDVQIAFQDIAEFALNDELYFKELAQTINNYNKIWMDLNDNGEKYLMDFELVWVGDLVPDLEQIYETIMDDIHRLNILKLNEVRTEIWNYANTSLSKSEKKNLEREIVKNTKRTAEDLGRRINVLDMQVARFLSDLKEDMRKSR